jgi:amidase
VGLADELHWIDALARAELVRSGELSARESVEAAIERIERLNPVLNAVVTETYELALSAADEVETSALLAGVPFLVKDLIATCEGVRHTAGSAFLRDFLADEDSELVARLKRAGLCIVGITNTAELGNASTTEPHRFGSTRNPWAPDRIPGGSSGGSAAAVAAGIVPAAHGNDGGGSIRIPASCCGVFGLKPTRGRNPLGPRYGDLYAGLVCEHALTRSVRDSAALLDATAGAAPGDPYYAPCSAHAWLAEVSADSQSGKRLRIGFATHALSGAHVHPACVTAVLRTAGLCAELGHEIEEAGPALDAAALGDAWFHLWADGNAWLVDAWSRRLGRKPAAGELEPLTAALVRLGRSRSAAKHLHSVQVIHEESRRVAAFFERYDLWLTPVLAHPPPPLGTLEPSAEQPLEWCEQDAAFAPFTAVANATGQPAMSVPLDWTDDSLPVGSHFLGRFGDEATLFRLAAQLEAAQPWSGRRPPSL